MRIQEMIFQDILGVSSAVRLNPEGELAHLSLPRGITEREVQALLLLSFFPTTLTEELSERLSLTEKSKLATVLETSAGEIRLIRRRDADTVRAQRKTAQGYEDLAKGATQVEAFLVSKLHLLEPKFFLPLYFWDFDPASVPARAAGSEFGDDPRIPELVEMYLTSLEVESLEDQIKEFELRVEEGHKALGQGSELEDKLERARDKLSEIEIEDLSEEELVLIEEKDSHLEQFREQLHRLRDEEEREQREVRGILPELPYRQPLFFVGALLAVGSLGISFALHESLRILSLVAIPGLGIAAFLLLQYFNRMNRASIHQVRLSSIRRRIDQVISDEIFFLERIDHLMVLLGVKDEQELRARIPMAAKLERVIVKMEEQLEAVRANPEYRRARKDLTSTEEELRALRARRKELPDFVMNSFQLESDLQTLEVNPVEVRKRAAQKKSAPQVEEQLPLDPFARLELVARETDQWKGDSLDETVCAIWSKICAHVLSDRFSEMNLKSGGKLSVGALTEEQLELWRRTRASEVRALQVALALALHVNHYRLQQGRSLASIWVGDLNTSLTPAQATKFQSVIKSAAKKSQIVFFESA